MRLQTIRNYFLSVVLVAAMGVSLVPPKTAFAATQISEVPISFGVTNGDILTTNIAVMAGTRAVMIGGNFSKVTTPNGVVHPAANFAILDLYNANRVIYAATGVNSYVRESYAHAGVVYVGGDFTTFAGQPRARLAAIGTSDLKLKSWNPGSSAEVEALTVNDSAVYFGGLFGTLRAVRTANAANPGQLIWSKPVTGGAVRVLMLSPAKTILFVGGLFETLGGVKQHGLVKLLASNGANQSNFKPTYMPNTYTGPQGSYDGDCILSLDFDAATNKVIVGGGGAKRNLLTYIDATTGAYRTSGWTTPPYRTSEGDIQGVALVGDTIVMGYHRGHFNGTDPSRPASKRYVTLVNKKTGAYSQTWDVGLWGVLPSADHGNGGVQQMTYDATSRKLVLVGDFKGYGDRYENGVAGEIVGKPGVNRPGIVVLNVTP